MDKITSKDYNLQSIIDDGMSFNIPRYQRLFVWKEEQVKTLFNDILTATFSEQDFYYIGGIITVKYDKIDNCFDLVDGQQRFTSLWLLANELGDSLNSFTKRDEILRLNFSIRKNVKHFFYKLLNESDLDTNETHFEDLIRISKAKRTIHSLINQNLATKERRKKFSDFVLTKLKMVITNVPTDTDLNKLFETLNNRGVQLSQHEILKAQLLANIKSKKTRNLFNVLWNTSSDMNDYIERNLAKEIGVAKDVADIYNQWEHTFSWTDIKKRIKQLSQQKNTTLELKDILKKNKKFEINEEKEIDIFHPDASANEFENVRSILSFPQLLLHTLRIYLYKNNKEDIQRINEKELLSIFDTYFFTSKEEKKENQEKESIEFIDLLTQVREVFDKYVIKWVEIEEKKETHLIKKIRKQNQKYRGWTYYLRREKTTQFNGLALLQSILYHSQQNTTQYWLTPFLNFVLEHPSFEDVYVDLKKTDNILFSSLQEDKNLPERTWACMDEYPEIKPTSEILVEKLGVNFPHYWFYKMEFILWHERASLNKDKEWAEYKMTARNSVEHISPQHPRFASDKLCKDELDGWGNLVLVTRSINSEYSDLPYSVKKAKFDDKKTKGSLDSLKSDLIYDYQDWNDRKAINHQEKMIEIMNKYFEDN